MKIMLACGIVALLILLAVYWIKNRTNKGNDPKFISVQIERDFKEELELYKIYIENQTQNELYQTFGNHDRQKARNIAIKQKELEPVLLGKYEHFLPNVVIKKKSVVYPRYAEALLKLEENKRHVRKMDKQKKPSNNSPDYQKYLAEYMMWRENIDTLEKEIAMYQLEHLILYQEYQYIDIYEERKDLN